MGYRGVAVRVGRAEAVALDKCLHNCDLMRLPSLKSSQRRPPGPAVDVDREQGMTIDR